MHPGRLGVVYTGGATIALAVLLTGFPAGCRHRRLLEACLHSLPPGGLQNIVATDGPDSKTLSPLAVPQKSPHAVTTFPADCCIPAFVIHDSLSFAPCICFTFLFNVSSFSSCPVPAWPSCRPHHSTGRLHIRPWPRIPAPFCSVQRGETIN